VRPNDLIPRRPSPGRHLYPGLVLAQGLHNFEEFVSGIYEQLPFTYTPEYFVLSSLAIVLLLAALIPSVAHGRRWALRVAKLIAILEVLNGTAHLMVTLIEWGYFPGAWTAPILLLFGAALGRSLRR
jgi:hypothetical protein